SATVTAWTSIAWMVLAPALVPRHELFDAVKREPSTILQKPAVATSWIQMLVPTLKRIGATPPDDSIVMHVPALAPGSRSMTLPRMIESLKPPKTRTTGSADANAPEKIALP